MSGSDDRPDVEALTLAAIADLAQDVEALQAQGQVLLSGPATVQFVVRVDDGATPQEAVEKVIRKIANVGLDTFTFGVTDMLTGEEHFVKAGQLVSLDDLQAAIRTDGQG